MTRCFKVDAEGMPHTFFLIEDTHSPPFTPGANLGCDRPAYITVKAIIISYIWVDAAHSNSSSRINGTNLIIRTSLRVPFLYIRERNFSFQFVASVVKAHCFRGRFSCQPSSFAKSLSPRLFLNLRSLSPFWNQNLLSR